MIWIYIYIQYISRNSHADGKCVAVRCRDLYFDAFLQRFLLLLAGAAAAD